MTLLWQKIYKEQEDKIFSGMFSKGDIFHTVKGLAEEYNVSTATSRRVLAELKSKGYIKGVKRVGNIVCRDISERKLYLVLAGGQEAATKDMNPLLFANLFMQMSKKISELGLKINTVSESKMFEEDTENDIFIAVYSSVWGNCRDVVQRSKGRVVFCNSPFEIDGAYSVVIDFDAAFMKVIGKLVDAGHRKIAFLDSWDESWWHSAMLVSYIKALQEYNITFDQKLIKYVDMDSGQDFRLILNQFMSMANPATAVFCANDTIAINLLSYCARNDISVPLELAICGFYNQYETQLTSPRITTVETFSERIGEESVNMAYDLIEGKEIEKCRKITPKLIVRQSI